MNKLCIPPAKSSEWGTPLALYTKLNHEFRFEIDAAASDDNALCEKYFTKDNSALENSWDGTTFCNPPYGRDIEKWVRKARQESLGEGGRTVVMLLPARTDTKWFHEIVQPHAEVRFIKGRLKYGNAKDSAPFPSMIAIFWSKGDWYTHHNKYR